MKAKQLICPISHAKIDNHTSRFNAALNTSMLLLFLYSGQPIFLWFTLLEFVVKVFVHKEYSPMHFAAQGLVRLVRLPVKLVDEAPKTFATRMGLICSALSVFFFYMGLPGASVAVAIVLASLMSLHALFNYCIGCVLYHYLVFPFFK